MGQAFLRATNLHKSYGTGRAKVDVLRGASLDLSEAEFVVVMGSSGSGKSTLLHLLGALDTPDRGKVEFRGISVFDRSASQRERYRNHDVGFVFQFYHLLPELTVLENVVMPRMVGQSFVGWRRTAAAARRDAAELLERMGLSERSSHRPRELSGGEQQRVAIARALINRPALLLADEPTGNLDARVGNEILNLLSESNKSGQTIVMVTHDAKVASRAHRQMFLGEGMLRRGDRVTNQPAIADPVITKVGQ